MGLGFLDWIFERGFLFAGGFQEVLVVLSHVVEPVGIFLVPGVEGAEVVVNPGAGVDGEAAGLGPGAPGLMVELFELFFGGPGEAGVLPYCGVDGDLPGVNEDAEAVSFCLAVHREYFINQACPRVLEVFEIEVCRGAEADGVEGVVVGGGVVAAALVGRQAVVPEDAFVDVDAGEGFLSPLPGGVGFVEVAGDGAVSGAVEGHAGAVVEHALDLLFAVLQVIGAGLGGDDAHGGDSQQGQGDVTEERHGLDRINKILERLTRSELGMRNEALLRG